jgi:hypothetical protein
MFCQVVPQARFELAKAGLLRTVGVPISISHRGKLVRPSGIEPDSSALQAAAMTTSAKVAWSSQQESNLYLSHTKRV